MGVQWIIFLNVFFFLANPKYLIAALSVVVGQLKHIFLSICFDLFSSIWQRAQWKSFSYLLPLLMPKGSWLVMLSIRGRVGGRVRCQSWYLSDPAAAQGWQFSAPRWNGYISATSAASISTTAQMNHLLLNLRYAHPQTAQSDAAFLLQLPFLSSNCFQNSGPFPSRSCKDSNRSVFMLSAIPTEGAGRVDIF